MNVIVAARGHKSKAIKIEIMDRNADGTFAQGREIILRAGEVLPSDICLHDGNMVTMTEIKSDAD